MVSEMPSGTWKAIGIVRNKITQWVGVTASRDVVSEIVLDGSLAEGLDGLDEFSHITVIYWMHQPPGPVPIKFHPGHKEELPLVGIFASRAPRRPNPVAKTIIRVLQRQGNVLTVKGLDAVDGTPVIDIMPYMPESDSVDDAKVPSWVIELFKSLKQ